MADREAKEAQATHHGEEGGHGWAPDMEDQTGAAEEGANKAYDASQAGASGPGRESSAAESQGVGPADTSAASPLGVGTSPSRSGEDVEQQEGKEAGRKDAGTQGPSERPVGTSDPEASTGVGAQDSSTESPTVQTGDQGG
jgi:hypothetical protein